MSPLLDQLEEAIRREPHRPELYLQLGTLLQQLGEPEAAQACYRDGLRADPDFVPLLQNLGFLLTHLGEPEAALECYERACRKTPSAMTRLLQALVLPAVYDSVAAIDRWRHRLVAELQTLVADGVRVPTQQSQIPTNFYLAYQGHNDRPIAELLARLYACGLPAPAGPIKPDPERRRRIGFLSAFFHDHTIGRLNLGLIEHLSRTQWEVTVLSVASPEDPWAQRFEAAADLFVPVPRDVVAARQLISACELDLLVFADVGMDSVTTTLAYSRMAPVQCVTWGHPVTTGSPTIDYFISSDLMEPADAEEHYTERLLRLPGTGVFYHRPAEPAPTTASAARGDVHRYACPQTLYKFHPDFDPVLAGILQADPQAQIVLLEGRIPNWTEQLKARFARTLPDPDRVQFLPALPHDEYLALLASADVLLDPLHFGGGNSSYEAFAMGVPVVTLPSSFLRGRITAGLCRRMELPELIVDSADAYVALAVRIASDPTFRETLTDKIHARSPILFENREEVADWERLLEKV